MDNPPAFPTMYHPDSHAGQGCAGMTLRDWFAGQAVAGITAALVGKREDDLTTDQWHQGMAHGAYSIADAMLAARSQATDKEMDRG